MCKNFLRTTIKKNGNINVKWTQFYNILTKNNRRLFSGKINQSNNHLHAQLYEIILRSHSLDLSEFGLRPKELDCGKSNSLVYWFCITRLYWDFYSLIFQYTKSLFKIIHTENWTTFNKNNLTRILTIILYREWNHNNLLFENIKENIKVQGWRKCFEIFWYVLILVV